MIDKAKALRILIDIIGGNKTHRDYLRVTRYSKLLKQLVTGEDMDDLIKRFVLREDADLFKQRLSITEQITKPLTRSAYRPINKISRATPIINEIVYPSKKTNNNNKANNTVSKEKVKENEARIKEAIAKIFGGESLEVMLEKKYGDLVAYEPNGFFLTSFKPYDNLTQEAEPYVTEVTAEQAIYYEYFNNVLQYLVARGDYNIPIKKINEEVSFQPAFEYHIYVDNDTVVFTPLDSSLYENIPEGIVTDVFIQNPAMSSEGFYGLNGKVFRFKDKRTFLVRYYNQKSGIVPAVRVGCIPDPLTDGRTCLSILDNAIPYLMKTIKTVSEMDLSMSLHAFPQKIVRTPSCRGIDNEGCNGGETRDGKQCRKCKGTGKAEVSTSSQVTIELNLPDDGDRNPDKMFDLEKIVHYVTLPIDILKFQNEYIEQLKADIMKAIYNSDTFTRATIADTATAKNIEYESVNDTLQPYAGQFSVIYINISTVSAHYLDIGTGIVVRHKFSRDFKLKGLTLLLADLKAVDDSNAPNFVREEISQDIANNLYQDRPDELKRIYWKNRFFPFGGKSKEEISLSLVSSDVMRESKILYYHFKEIFVVLEQKADLMGLFLYDHPYEILKKKIDEEVKAIMEKIDSANTISIAFDPSKKFGEDDPTNPDDKKDSDGSPQPDKKDKGNPLDKTDPNPEPEA